MMSRLMKASGAQGGSDKGVDNFTRSISKAFSEAVDKFTKKSLDRYEDTAKKNTAVLNQIEKTLQDQSSELSLIHKAVSYNTSRVSASVADLDKSISGLKTESKRDKKKARDGISGLHEATESGNKTAESTESKIEDVADETKKVVGAVDKGVSALGEGLEGIADAQKSTADKLEDLAKEFRRGGGIVNTLAANRMDRGARGLRGGGSPMDKIMGQVMGLFMKLTPMLGIALVLFKAFAGAASAAKDLRDDLIKPLAESGDLLSEAMHGLGRDFDNLSGSALGVGYRLNDMLLPSAQGLREANPFRTDLSPAETMFGAKARHLMSNEEIGQYLSTLRQSGITASEDNGGTTLDLAMSASTLLGSDLSEMITASDSLGVSLDSVSSQFVNVAAVAAESGFGTKRFGQALMGTTANMFLYNRRLGATASLLSGLSDTLGFEGGSNFLQGLTGAFEPGGGSENLRRVALLSGGDPSRVASIASEQGTDAFNLMGDQLKDYLHRFASIDSFGDMQGMSQEALRAVLGNIINQVNEGALDSNATSEFQALYDLNRMSSSDNMDLQAGLISNLDENSRAGLLFQGLEQLTGGSGGSLADLLSTASGQEMVNSLGFGFDNEALRTLALRVDTFKGQNEESQRRRGFYESNGQLLNAADDSVIGDATNANILQSLLTLDSDNVALEALSNEEQLLEAARQSNTLMRAENATSLAIEAAIGLMLKAIENIAGMLGIHWGMEEEEEPELDTSNYQYDEQDRRDNVRRTLSRHGLGSDFSDSDLDDMISSAIQWQNGAGTLAASLSNSDLGDILDRTDMSTADFVRMSEGITPDAIEDRVFSRSFNDFVYANGRAHPIDSMDQFFGAKKGGAIDTAVNRVESAGKGGNTVTININGGDLQRVRRTVVDVMTKMGYRATRRRT
jgi:hypothetical protein